MSTGCDRELFEVVEVNGHDLVPVGGEQHDGGVDDVSEAGIALSLSHALEAGRRVCDGEIPQQKFGTLWRFDRNA